MRVKGPRLVSLMTTIVVVLALPTASADDPLPVPSGKILLTVSGKITHTNAGDAAVFDRQMLESFGISELELTTPWTQGRQKFSGVLGRKILDAVGAKGNTIVARAINDYQISIPVSDLRDYPVLLALKQNGSYMRVRDKGPIWIIYPRETYPELDTDQVTDRWVWQLSRMIIE